MAKRNHHKTKITMKQIIAYTDGSAVVSGANKGRGGYGAFFPDFYGKPKGLHEGFLYTKTGRTEMHALLSAINAFDWKTDAADEHVMLTVYSDSQYVVKAFTDGRLNKWKDNGWTNSSGKVKNKDLWLRILYALEQRRYLKLDMIWIKGHQLDKEKNPVAKAYLMQDPHIVGNAMADILADRWRLGINLKHDLNKDQL
tara:strand:+ start:499 stop:1092 length:594 start_codon:yes stop_codon:yes gene_type:complete